MSNKIITWELDPSSWRFTVVSPHVVELFGYPLSDWYSENFWTDHIHPDDRRQTVDYCKSATGNGEDHEFEYRMVAADGRDVWVRDFVAVEMEEDRPKLLRGFLIDITDEKKAGQSKRETEMLFEQAARIANVGHWEWDEIADRLITCSEEMARIFGVSVDDYSENSATLDAALKWVHPEEREQYAREREEYREANTHGYDKSVPLDCEYRITKQDEEVRYIRELAEPVFDDSGRHYRSVGTVQDISDQKRLEVQLQESEERLHLVIDNSPTAIFLKDEEGRYQVVNTKFCEWFGGTPEDVIGKTFYDLAAPKHADEAATEDKAIFASKTNLAWEFTLPFIDGETHTILAHKFPIFGTDGEVKAVGGVDVDITDRKKTETMNVRLGRIIDRSVNEVFCFNADTLKFETVNRGACKNLGYTLEEMMNLTPLDIKPEYTLETFEELIKPLRDGEREQIVFETVHQRKDGSTYDAEVHLQLISTETPPVFAAIIQDITGRKAAERKIRKAHDELELRVHERTEQLQGEVEERKYIEAALRKSEERARDLAKSSSDWFWETGPDLRLSYVSSRYEKITGMESNWFIGKSVEELVVPGEDKEKWQNHLDDMHNHRSFRDFQYEQKHPDGGTLHVRVGGVPVFNDNDEFTGYRGTTTNITAQVLAERRAATAEHQLVDAIEGLNQGIVLYDADERFVVCNSKYREVVNEISDILVPGITFEDVCRKSFERGIVSGWDDMEKWVESRLARFRQDSQPIIHQLRTGQWIMTTEHKTRNGSTLTIRSDVTELKETQFQLEAAKTAAEDASGLKSNFLANMSHELRTPLNAIIGFTDIMRQQALGPMENGKYLEYAGDIHQAGQHLLDLIDDILDLSAIEAGKLGLQKESFEVAEVVAASLKFVSLRAETEGVQVSMNIEDGLPPLYADKRRILQVIINLLTNAVKFTPAGGRVLVTASKIGNSDLQITITDTGIGMDEQGLDQAMSKFGRADSKVARNREGTGLGLPLSKSLMELHGGTLDLSSSPGAGTVVRLQFPIAN